MENSIDTSERTLIIFDAVCCGLTDCLNLVHSDIKQMTEHRNQLAILEHERIQAKLLPPHELVACDDDELNGYSNKTNKLLISATSNHKGLRPETIENSIDQKHHNQHHQLAGLEMLDKQLAESFSQAFNLNDQHKTSILAKEQQHFANNNKPNIFQVLLGRSSQSKSNLVSVSSKIISKKRDNVIQNNNNNNDKNSNHGINRQTKSGSLELDNKLVIDDINKQIRLAMQYAKQLEAHLFKIEDLKSRYEMHLKMGSVVKSVSRACLHSSCDTSEFESYMGSFLFAIEDIQGFARVCPGDVFEISIKYGESEKFKTKVSVLKDNRQKCDNRQAVFKARILDKLAIKAYECKGIRKRVLLGHKSCETRDLFTARSQLMTISLNQTGSIKLNLIVTWNPLHLAPNNAPMDISHISLPSMSGYSSTMSSVTSMPSFNETSTMHIDSPNLNTINRLQSDMKRLNSSPVTFDKRNKRSPRPTNNLEDNQHPSDSVYQTVDPTYGYYIPPPDYMTNEFRCEDYRC